MLDLLQSFVALGAALALNAARRAIGTLVGILGAVGLAAISLLFFTMAGYRGLDRVVGDLYALVIIGCIYFVAALITLLVVQARKT